MNAYLISFDTERVNRHKFLDIVDSTPEIANWYAFFPGSVAVVSEADVKKVARSIRDQSPLAPFVITKIEKGERAGFLPGSVWDFIKNPKSLNSVAS